MKKLIDIEEDIFYRGTIIVLKDADEDIYGIKSDMRYAMLSPWGGIGNFQILNLWRAIGGMTSHDLQPNVQGHFAVDKNAIRQWVSDLYKYYFNESAFQKVTEEWLNDTIYIENLDDYFEQANRDIKVK